MECVTEIYSKKKKIITIIKQYKYGIQAYLFVKNVLKLGQYANYIAH